MRRDHRPRPSRRDTSRLIVGNKDVLRNASGADALVLVFHVLGLGDHPLAVVSTIGQDGNVLPGSRAPVRPVLGLFRALEPGARTTRALSGRSSRVTKQILVRGPQTLVPFPASALCKVGNTLVATKPWVALGVVFDGQGNRLAREDVSVATVDETAKGAIDGKEGSVIQAASVGKIIVGHGNPIARSARLAGSGLAAVVLQGVLACVLDDNVAVGTARVASTPMLMGPFDVESRAFVVIHSGGPRAVHVENAFVVHHRQS